MFTCTKKFVSKLENLHPASLASHSCTAKIISANQYSHTSCYNIMHYKTEGCTHINIQPCKYLFYTFYFVCVRNSKLIKTRSATSINKVNFFASLFECRTVFMTVNFIC